MFIFYCVILIVPKNCNFWIDYLLDIRLVISNSGVYIVYFDHSYSHWDFFFNVHKASFINLNPKHFTPFLNIFLHFPSPFLLFSLNRHFFHLCPQRPPTPPLPPTSIVFFIIYTPVNYYKFIQWTKKIAFILFKRKCTLKMQQNCHNIDITLLDAVRTYIALCVFFFFN